MDLFIFRCKKQKKKKKFHLHIIFHCYLFETSKNIKKKNDAKNKDINSLLSRSRIRSKKSNLLSYRLKPENLNE